MLEAALALLVMIQTPYQEHQCDNPQSQYDMNELHSFPTRRSSDLKSVV